jgi:hypothetical protein
MDWVAAAEEFLGKHGWGARGRNLGVSRMFGTGDIGSCVRNAHVAALRPRGVISGFLTIVPGTGVVYIPPIAAKVPPQRLRLRVSSQLLTNGAIFSAYMTRESPRTLVIEDILVWNGTDVWSGRKFSDRWNNLLAEFAAAHFRSDTILQGCAVVFATYCAPNTLSEPDEKHVIELVPEAAGVKRLIWMPPRAAPVLTPASEADVPAMKEQQFSVQKEVGMGPDVYAVYKGATRLGLALVRTLAISKALRLACGPVGGAAVPVRAELNKTFEKYEILEVLSA